MLGNDLGAHNVRSAGMAPALTALASISKASPAMGGITTVARNCPLRTHSWPVLVTPSQPRKGVCNQRSPSASFMSTRAFLAPIAIASFWQTTAWICNSFEVLSDIQDFTTWWALRSDQSPLRIFIVTPPGLVESIPLVRRFAALLLDGPST